MTEIVRGDGMKYALVYNEFHNLESIGVDGKDEKLVQYTYKTGNGRLKEIAYANGDKMKATYNSIGQMVAEKWYNSSNELTAHYKYVYDGQGNIVRSIDIAGEKEYNYEYEDGRLMRATEANVELSGEVVISKVVVNTVKYYYDTEDKMTKKVITPANGSAQTIYYETADDNTVVKFSAGGRTVTSHSKTDSFGRKVFDELQLGTGFVSRQFSYHSGDVTQEHKDNAKLKSSATTNLVSQIVLSDGRTLSYGYDAEERITSVVESYEVDNVPVTNTTLYTYDGLGQLLTETVNGEVVNSMEYDNYGNIVKKNGKAYTYGDATWKDLLTEFDGQSITYDAQGNPINYLGHTLTWEKGRQLKSFDGNTYTYNANGIRTSKTVGGVKHTYTLDGTKILRETWGNNTLIPLYDNEDGVCGILYNNEPYYFQKNLQGDIIDIVNKDAEVVAKYSYDAWGVPTIVQDSTECGVAQINPYRYRGYYFDSETGLYYLQSRYYDPKVGRFISADSIEFISVTTNVLVHDLFAYCENNIVNNSDEFGAISLKTVMSFLNSLMKVIKKVVGWVKKIVAGLLSLYTGLSPKDVSSIAKDIGRSPHRVRQAIESIVKKLGKVKNYVGKFALGVSILAMIALIGEKITRLGNIAKTIAECVVEALTSCLKWLLSKGLKALSSLVPMIGSIIGFFASSIVSFLFNKIFTNKKVENLKQKITNRIELATYDLADYFKVFLKNLA